MGKITNKDIARMAGVSPAAVSIAINGKQGISEQTRQKILNIARQYDYCTGTNSARELRDHSKFIAVLFRTDAQLDDQVFYSEMGVNGMVACREMGYTFVSTFVTDDRGFMEIPPAIRNGEVDGILVFGDQNFSLYRELERGGTPFVVLDSSHRNNPYPCVFVDYTRAAYEATRHLIDLGHRDIVYLSNGNLHDFNTMTLAGFQKAILEAGIALYPNRFQIDVEGEEALRRSVDQALAGVQRPTAIFCTVDIYAINAIRYLQSKGLRVPEDIAVIGIDDVMISRMVSPGLSTMQVDRKEMFSIGLQMLTEMMRGEKVESRKLPPCKLILRDSTGGPIE